MSALLSVEAVTRQYRMPRLSLFQPAPLLTAVQDVSFTLDTGHTLGIVGESGSGKSTLARLVMGFETPDAGRVVFDGQDLAQLSPAAMRLRVLNVTSGENAAFDLMFRLAVAPSDP
ncbi:MAG: ABC transporter, partial [Rhodobacteraceae bacterium HLUCCO07]